MWQVSQAKFLQEKEDDMVTEFDQERRQAKHKSISRSV